MDNQFSAIVKYENVARSFPGQSGRFQGIKDINQEIQEGDTQVWLGHSGSGKTTAARILSGLETPDTGKVFVRGQDITNIPPHLRARNPQIGIYHVFQHGGLYPFKSVGGNLRMGPLVRRLEPSIYKKRLFHAITSLFPDIQDEPSINYLLHKRPDQLSGGERQRINLAKALIIQASITILDEPLSNVDAPNRAAIRREIRRLTKELNMTTIWITHDQEEAITVADKIAVFHHGNILQTGTPENLESQPVHTEVARFVSNGMGIPINLIRFKPKETPHWSHESINLETLKRRKSYDGDIIAGVYADAFTIQRLNNGHVPIGFVEAKIDCIERLRSRYLFILSLPSKESLVVLSTQRALDVRSIENGRVAIKVNHIAHMFDANTGMSL